MTKHCRGRYPCASYVATFADGTVRRMGFWTPLNKPIDFARGRRVSVRWHWPSNKTRPPYFAEIPHDGYVDLNDGSALIPDPFFHPETAVEPIKPARAPSGRQVLVVVKRVIDNPDDVEAGAKLSAWLRAA